MCEVIFKKRIPGKIDKVIYRAEMSVIPRKDEYICRSQYDEPMLVYEILWILEENQVWAYVK